MHNREMVGMLGIDIEKKFPSCLVWGRSSPGLPVRCTPRFCRRIIRWAWSFLVLSFVVVVVGGMGSLGGAVAAGFLLGVLQSFASMNEIKSILPGIDQIIIYLVAILIILLRPRGLMGREGVMED